VTVTQARTHMLKTVPRARLRPRSSKLLLVLPGVLLFAVFFAWPLLEITLRSLNESGEVSYSSPTLSLANYREIIEDSALRGVVTHTFVIAFWSTVITVLLAFPTAYLMSRLSRRVALVLLTLVLIPFWVSILVRLFAYTQVLSHSGIVNSLAGELGLGPYEMLFSTRATIFGMVAYLLPYMILMLYSGMSGLDTSLITAAKTLGSTGAQAFRHIYFPLIRPTLLAATLLVFVLGLGFFLTPALLGGAKDTTIAMYIQQQVDTLQWGTASATGVVLLIITVVGYALALRLGGFGMLSGGGGATGKGSVEREPLRLSPGTVALWTITVVVLVILLVPLLIIVPSSFDTSSTLGWPPKGFTTEWYSTVTSDPLWTQALKKSLIVGLVTAVLSTLIGLSLARVFQGLRSQAGRLTFQALAVAPLIAPVILLAVGIFSVQIRLDLLDTNIGLVLAHAVLAIPLAFVVLTAALANTDPALEAAAWTMGASRTRAFWTVTVPAIAPSLVGALLLTFLTSWDEVVIALFQSGIQKTLPVTIFSFLKSGVEPSVAAIAVLLVAVVAVGVIVTAIIGRRREKKLTRPDALTA
jgi:putative spermidine/putrescine transport system permease protein